jgi:anthranilate synthase component 2
MSSRVAGTHVVVVDHHDSYTFNLVHLVASVTGETPRVVEHDEVDDQGVLAGGCTHVVLSPGPGNPDAPRDFSVGHALLHQSRVPVLGVCLGMQGLVTAFGGRVRAVRPAHGEVAEVDHDGTGLFAGLPQGFAAVRYHSLAAVTVPDALRVTAWCDEPVAPAPDGEALTERVVMGVAHRELPHCGVQFHPESILTQHGADLVANFLERP